MKVIGKKEHYLDKEMETAIVPPDCTLVEDWAFGFCPALTKTWIPSGCRVSEKAFAGSDGLEEIFLYADAQALELGRSINEDPMLLALWIKNCPRDMEKALKMAGEGEAFYPWFDESLMRLLKQPDDTGFTPFLAGGEEDYSDEGEEKKAYIRKMKKEKIRLAACRLFSDRADEDVEKEPGSVTAVALDLFQSYINESDPALYFSLIKEEGEAGEMYRKLFSRRQLFSHVDRDRLLGLAGEDVTLRAMILTRKKEEREESFFDVLTL
ncbi:MAG: hypothetical protein K5739_07900 [Lachnospiraceae bacterium]|nr:hypothetical protein [Lachnospiraceae bacterium]